MAEDGFTLNEDDKAELRQRLAETRESKSAFDAQRNVIVETDNPDDAAYDLKKGSELGIPRVAVAGDRDGYKSEDTLARLERMAKEAPKTRSWLDAPDNFALARDEVEGLSALEKLAEAYLKTGAAVRTFGPAVRQAIAGTATSSLENPSLVPVVPIDAILLKNQDKIKGLPEIKQAASRTKNAVKGPDFSGFRNPFKRNPLKMGRMDDLTESTGKVGGALTRARERAIENSIEDGRRAGADLEATMPRSDDPTVQAYLSGISSLVQMAPAMATGLVSRNANTPLAVMGRQVYGQEYADARSEGFEPGGAGLIAGAHSGIERVTEMLPMEILFGSDQIGKNYLKRWVKSQGAEAITEQFATVGQDFVDWQAKHPEKTVEQFIDERPAAAYQTFVATMVASGVMNTAVLGTEKALVDMAERQRQLEMTPGEQTLDKLLTQAGKPKLRKRSPEKMQEFLEQITEGEGPNGERLDTIEIDLQGLATTLEETSQDPTEFLEGLGLPEDALEQAFDMTGMIEVPTAKALSSDAVMDNLDVLKPHMRLVGEAHTPQQRKAAQETAQDDLKDIVEAHKSIIEGRVEGEVSDANITAQLEDRITQTGMYADPQEVTANATVISSMVSWLAKVQGRSAQEVFDEQGPAIMGVFGLGDEQVQMGDDVVMQQAQDNGFEGTDMEGAQEWEAARAKGLDMSTEGRMARAKEMGFDTENELYHGSLDTFDAFDPNMSGSGAIHLTESEDFARQYAATKSQDAQLDKTPRVGAYYVRGNFFDPSDKAHLDALELVLPDELTWTSSYGWAQYGSGFRETKASLLKKAQGIGRPHTPLTEAIYNDAIPGQPLKEYLDGQKVIVTDKGDGWIEVISQHDSTRNRDINELNRLRGKREAGEPLNDIERERYLSLMDMRGRRDLQSPKRISLNPDEQSGFDSWAILESEELRPFIEKAGFDGAQATEGKTTTTIIFDPSNIRSVNAAFDPDHADSANLLNQLIGPKAKTADKAILKTAQKMAKETVKVRVEGKRLKQKRAKYTRQQIWDKTAEMGQPWYQAEDGSWISEVEDGVVVVNEGKGKVSEVIEYPALYEQYPQVGEMRADARDTVTVREETGDRDVPGTKGTFTPSPMIWSPHVRISDQGENSAEYTAVHELTHAIDAIEGRLKSKEPYLLQPTERRAFNAMYRRQWTMAERIATPPWKTEQEAINWFQGGRDLDAPRARYAKDGTYDPMAQIAPPKSAEQQWREADPAAENDPRARRSDRDLELPGERVPQRITDSDGFIMNASATIGETPYVMGRTFLSMKEFLRALPHMNITQRPSEEAISNAIDELRLTPANGTKDSLVSYIKKSADPVDTLARLVASAAVGRGVKVPSPERAKQVVESALGNPVKNQAFLDTPEAYLLDLDTPLGEQSKAHQAALTRLIEQGYPGTSLAYMRGLPTVKHVIEELALLGDNEQHGSRLMRDLISDMREVGIYGGTYTSGGIKADGPPQFSSVIVFDETASIATRDNAGNLMQGTAGNYSPSQNAIRLFEAKNVSTLMHESAHWFLDTLEKINQSDQAPAEITAMLENIRVWHGMPADQSIYDENGVVTPEGRELHEAFAETFEVYLRSGKAPNAKLREAFRFFKQWLTQLYKKVAGNPSLTRANLNPEITDIFDRMLGVEDAVDVATSGIKVEAQIMVDQMLESGVLTEREHARAKERLANAIEEVKEEWTAKLFDEAEKRHKAWEKGERRILREEAIRDFDRSDVGRAEGVLGRGEWMGDVVTPSEPGALDQTLSSMRHVMQMTDDEAAQWYAESITESVQDMGNGTTRIGLSFRLTDEADAPYVDVPIIIQDGVANVDILLNGQMTSEQGARNHVSGMQMFAGVVTALRHRLMNEDVRAIKMAPLTPGHRKLYGFMLSHLRFDGFVPYITTQETSSISLEDGVYSAEPVRFGAGAVFHLVREGVDPNEFADTTNEKTLPEEGASRLGVQTNFERVPFANRRSDGVDAGRQDVGQSDTGSVLSQTVEDRRQQAAVAAFKEAAACTANQTAGVGAMVAGNLLGLSIAGTGVAIVMHATDDEGRARRKKIADQIAFDERLRTDPEFKRAYTNARDAAAKEAMEAEVARETEAERKRVEALYSDVDNMPTDNQFNMNGWAEQAVGVDAGFLDDLIGHEAADDWSAANPESSARGGAQFIESTWFYQMAKHGAQHGADDPHLTQAYETGRDIAQRTGRSEEREVARAYRKLARKDEQSALLDLREDRRWGTMIAAHFTRDNVEHLERATGKQINHKQAYLAHFLGVDTAVKALRADPEANAAEMFPAAAGANQNVFYKRGNLENPRTMKEMIARQGGNFSSAPALIDHEYLSLEDAAVSDSMVDREVTA